jgi:hypothetical protein
MNNFVDLTGHDAGEEELQNLVAAQQKEVQNDVLLYKKKTAKVNQAIKCDAVVKYQPLLSTLEDGYEHDVHVTKAFHYEQNSTRDGLDQKLHEELNVKHALDREEFEAGLLNERVQLDDRVSERRQHMEENQTDETNQRLVKFNDDKMALQKKMDAEVASIARERNGKRGLTRLLKEQKLEAQHEVVKAALKQRFAIEAGDVGNGYESEADDGDEVRALVRTVKKDSQDSTEKARAQPSLVKVEQECTPPSQPNASSSALRSRVERQSAFTQSMREAMSEQQQEQQLHQAKQPGQAPYGYNKSVAASRSPASSSSSSSSSSSCVPGSRSGFKEETLLMSMSTPSLNGQKRGYNESFGSGGGSTSREDLERRALRATELSSSASTSVTELSVPSPKGEEVEQKTGRLSWGPVIQYKVIMAMAIYGFGKWRDISQLVGRDHEKIRGWVKRQSQERIPIHLRRESIIQSGNNADMKEMARFEKSVCHKIYGQLPVEQLLGVKSKDGTTIGVSEYKTA